MMNTTTQTDNYYGSTEVQQIIKQKTEENNKISVGISLTQIAKKICMFSITLMTLLMMIAIIVMSNSLFM